MANEAPVERRLAAILAADVVGYSRLMGADEVGTLRALQACRRELIDPAIAGRRGRIFKTTGDGLLVEFPSAVDAVACAITVQQGMTRRNADTAEDKRLVFRVGINIGDVILDKDDVFGDGVNVAARLESLCEPGGICLSRSVRDQVRDKLPLAFDDLGEQTVKNIARPVRAFALGPQPIAAAPAPETAPAVAPRRRAWPWLGAGAAAILLTAAGAAWWALREPAAAPQPVAAAVSFPAPIPAARASIAVLPFTQLGGESSGDYFADGLTEDIIAALGRFRELSVIARAAVFAYKGKNPTPAEVGRDLKVRYILEGSVRRSLERIRVSVSLTDASRSAVLWSEKYDAEPKDIFSVQDQITRRISGALAVRVTSLELARSAAKPADSLEAYDLVLRGRALSARQTRAANAEARSLFERAIELDPKYAPAYVGLANVNLRAALVGWTQDPGEALERAEKLATQAASLDGLNAAAYALLGEVELYFGEYDRALDQLRQAIELNGSEAQSHEGLLAVLLFRGDLQGAIAAGETLAQLQPDMSDAAAFHLGMAYVLADRGADAVRVLQRLLGRNPEFLYGKVQLAAAYAETGRQPEAEQLAVEIRRRYPNFSTDEFGSLLRDSTLRAKLADALRKAGL
jgi:class 3 adenylate cyclase/TolB-like protein/Flp pilus assembly protein TadD